MGKMKAAMKKNAVEQDINKIEQKLTVKENLTFDHFPASIEYVYLAPKHDLS